MLGIYNDQNLKSDLKIFGCHWTGISWAMHQFDVQFAAFLNHFRNLDPDYWDVV